MENKKLDFEQFSKLYDQLDKFNQELAYVLGMSGITYTISNNKIISNCNENDMRYFRNLASRRVQNK